MRCGIEDFFFGHSVIRSFNLIKLRDFCCGFQAPILLQTLFIIVLSAISFVRGPLKVAARSFVDIRKFRRSLVVARFKILYALALSASFVGGLVFEIKSLSVTVFTILNIIYFSSVKSKGN